jgi:hypothetical protein
LKEKVATDTRESSLIAMLWNKMTLSEETPRELAEHLQISYVYLMALARGERPLDKADRKVFVMAASYLGIPVAQAYLLGGALQPSDFLVESTTSAKISQIFDRLKSDPEWGGFAPSSNVFGKLPKDVKILVCLLYERAAQTSDLTAVLVPPAS